MAVVERRERDGHSEWARYADFDLAAPGASSEPFDANTGESFGFGIVALSGRVQVCVYVCVCVCVCVCACIHTHIVHV